MVCKVTLRSRLYFTRGAQIVCVGVGCGLVGWIAAGGLGRGWLWRGGVDGLGARRGGLVIGRRVGGRSGGGTRGRWAGRSFDGLVRGVASLLSAEPLRHCRAEECGRLGVRGRWGGRAVTSFRAGGELAARRIHT